MATDDPVEVENWVRLRVLGSGGFGVVTLWKHKFKDEMIALKKCRSGTDNHLTPKHKERWSKEVEIMQRLAHPNVVRAIAVPPDLATLRSELPLLCMEFCSKGDLRQILNRTENCCGLRENDVRAIVSDVKSAIQYLHSMKITHRDLKPENIVLQQKDSKIVYKLIDLGYAKEWDQSSLCTSFVGTLQYLAPELFMNKTYSSSVDYWSLGLVSHEVITGARPFLPNMAPVTWMTHVRNKSSDDISAYQAEDGSIVFCKELFPQNHITSSLKYHMEEWLKLLLEWDPKKRGKNKDSKVIVFDLVEGILSKKILHIFSVPTYEHLSYEVDESTAVSTLQDWIKRDTGLPVKEQELLLPSGITVDTAKEAFHCWTPLTQDNIPMIFVFKCHELSIPQVTPRIPLTVGKMMEEPRNPLEYVHIKRAWSHAVFFLQQESELYHTFLLAYRVKIRQILSTSDYLKHQAQAMASEFQQAEAEHNLTTQSLQLDEDQLQRLRGRQNAMLDKWRQNHESCSLRIKTLRDMVTQLLTRTAAAHGKTTSLPTSVYLRPPERDVLHTLSEAGLRCYDQLRRRPREVRSQKMDSIEMVKVVYNCLKQRDILLRDTEFNSHLQQVAGIQDDLEQLLSPSKQCLAELKRLRLEVCQMQLERQKDIWKLMDSHQLNGLLMPKSFDDISNSCESRIKENRRSPSLPQVGLTPSISAGTTGPMSAPHILGNSSSEQSSMTGDTTAMIEHNMELRYRTQELMNESFQQYLSIVSEGQSMNWSHLDMNT
ncbi:inhibitor of nuclear factor kappa-B kinase subunit alpha [Anabrus simplex]|uniref:inhibitor of nuclear factor kappa-B kinase subunit alpha n=1 Tax=Anabrus simplex TaxID=316456 RepID=UPI0035A2FFE0